MLILLGEISGKANSQFRVAALSCDENLEASLNNSNYTAR
jgi:hypothetical protein